MKMILLMPVLSLVLSAPGLTGEKDEKIELKEKFSSIHIKGAVKVILVENGNSNTIRYKNGKITATVANDELSIKQKKSLLSVHQPLIVIPVHHLNALSISDNAAVFSQGSIKTDELEIYHRGDGTVKLTVTANKVYIQSAGKGKIQIDGEFTSVLSSRDEAGNIVLEYKN